MVFKSMKSFNIYLVKNLCVRHSLKFHGVAFNEGLKLPRKTSDIAGFLNKAIFFLASKTGTQCPRVLTVQLSKVPVCFLHGDFQEQWPTNPREDASPNPFLYCSCAVKTNDCHLGFIQSHTRTLILFQIQVDGGFLWSHI